MLAELSDDSDIEVHPNADKRSFIRAKQNQIHTEPQNKKLDGKNIEKDKRQDALLEEPAIHRQNIQDLQSGLVKKLESLEK